MRLKLPLTLLLCQCLIAGAQQRFERTYGGAKDENTDCLPRTIGFLTQTKEGGYAICDATFSYGAGVPNNEKSAYFLKLNNLGDTLNTRTYFYAPPGVAMDCQGRSVFQTSDSKFILGVDYGGKGLGLIRTTSNGDTIWSRRYIYVNTGGTTTGYYAIPLSDGNFLGTATALFGWGPKGTLVKVSATGALMYSRIYQTPGATISGVNLYSTSEAKYGNLISTGFHEVTANDLNVFVMKTDANGNIIWAKSYGTPDAEMAYTAKEQPDRSILITGWAGYDYADAFVMRTDSMGNILSAYNYGDTLSQWFNTLTTDVSGNIYVSGMTALAGPSGNYGQAIMGKLDANGNFLWGKLHGGSGSAGSGIIKTTDGGLAMGGFTNVGQGLTDILLVKTDSTGNTLCNTGAVSYTRTPSNFTTSTVSLTVISNSMIAVPAAVMVNGGTFVGTICLETGVHESLVDDGNGLVFPNPSTGIFHIQHPDGISEITLFDIQGKQLLKQPVYAFDGILTLNAQYAPGIYFLRIKTSNGQEGNFKIQYQPD